MSDTTERGYGGAHQAERRRWQRRLDQGEVILCSRNAESYCTHRPIDPRNWHLDHSDDRTAWLGPAHPPCNAYAGMAKQPEPKMIIREWP